MEHNASVGASEWQIRKVAIMSTGSEILQGQYADSNARYIAEQLTLAGLTVAVIAAAPDDAAAIERVVRFCADQADLIICTGGLGPTRDDLNRFVFEKLFGASLERDETAVESMRQRFLTRGYGEMPAANKVQALLPRGCTPFYNQWGTAPGFLIRPNRDAPIGRCGLLALPGPPREMVPMFEAVAMPALRPFLPENAVTGIRTVHTFGQAESYIGALVADMFCPLPGVVFSILAKPHGVDLRICATAPSEVELNFRLDSLESEVRQRLGEECIYGLDDTTLAAAVGNLLKANSSWVTTAESCTGGLVAQLLTTIEGSSAYVGECHVTYSNEAKMRVLGVQSETLEQHGAVSAECAVEMAEGARRVSGADYAISVTGIAGPGGGSDTKPVGLVYISVAGPRRTVTIKNQFLGDRDSNREQSALVALNTLRLELLRA